MSSELTSSVSSLLTAVHGALNVNIYFYKHKVPFYLDIYICNILNITHNVRCTVYVSNGRSSCCRCAGGGCPRRPPTPAWPARASPARCGGQVLGPCRCGGQQCPVHAFVDLLYIFEINLYFMWLRGKWSMCSKCSLTSTLNILSSEAQFLGCLG